MSNKKHIDRLFQEGFKNFDAKPNDAIWKNIKANLEEEEEDKKRRITPIWWRFAGAAALLLLFLTIGSAVFNKNTNENYNPQVVDIENTIPKTEKSLDNTNAITTNKNVNNTNNNNTINKQNNENQLEHKIKNKIKAEVNKIATTKETIKAKPISKKHKDAGKPNNTPTKHLRQKSNFPKDKIGSNINNAIAKAKSSILNNITNLENPADNKGTYTTLNKTKNNAKLLNLSNKARLAVNTKKLSKNLLENIGTTTIEDKKNKKITDNQVQKTSKRSIEDALNAPEANITEENKPKNRWQVAPNIAPVYFNTAGNGSSIDPQFNNNTVSGDINMSIGISTSYAITKEMTIRTGLHNVNLGYNVKDVTLYQSIGRSSSDNDLKNIDTETNRITVVSTATLGTNVLSNITTTNAAINQNLRFIEMPVEIQYTLSAKKIGINVIGGFSSFFLNSSKVFIEEENGNRTILGKANNLNNLSYSANLGLGLNYKISKKLNFNLEPVFKYQFNTFNNTSGDFTPFFIGVYTGMAIKF